MNADVKNRFQIDKVFKRELGENYEKVKVVYYCAVKIRDEVMLIVSQNKDIERKDIIEFAKDYIGEGNYDELTPFKGSFFSKIEGNGRMLLSANIISSDKSDEETLNLFLRRYKSLIDKKMVAFLVTDGNMFEDTQITRIKTKKSSNEFE